MPKVNNKAEFYAALKSSAVSCSLKEFKEFLLRFGHDEQALNALQKAVNELSRDEDRGSYCENATPGWDDYIDKKDMLVNFRLGTGEFNGVFRKATAKNAEPAEPTLQQLFDQVAELSRRIEKLEGANKPKPPRRNT